MLYPVEMPGGVLILRRIATSHMATGQADSQMDPTVTHLDALFTNPLRWLQVLGLSYVFADLHIPSLGISREAAPFLRPVHHIPVTDANSEVKPDTGDAKMDYGFSPHTERPGRPHSGVSAADARADRAHSPDGPLPDGP